MARKAQIKRLLKCKHCDFLSNDPGNKFRHEATCKEKFDIYGGPVDKRKKTFDGACQSSIDFDGTLKHTYRFMCEPIPPDENKVETMSVKSSTKVDTDTQKRVAELEAEVAKLRLSKEIAESPLPFQKDCYIYIFRLRSAVESKASYYKVGSSKDAFNRHKQYEAGAVIIGIYRVDSSDDPNKHKTVEKELHEMLRKDPKVIHRKDMGNETYEVDGHYLLSVVLGKVYPNQ